MLRHTFQIYQDSVGCWHWWLLDRAHAVLASGHGIDLAEARRQIRMVKTLRTKFARVEVLD